jgi:hypothetical protein
MIWHIFDLEKNEYVKIDVVLFLWFGNDINKKFRIDIQKF